MCGEGSSEGEGKAQLEGMFHGGRCGAVLLPCNLRQQQTAQKERFVKKIFMILKIDSVEGRMEA